MKLPNKKFIQPGQAVAALFQGKTEITLDVRPIIDKGVDPFEEIIKSLCRLGENEYLKIINYFEPIPLYARLKEMGYAYNARKHGIFYYIKIIRNPDLRDSEKEQKPPMGQTGTPSTFDSNGFLEVSEDRLQGLAEKLKKENPQNVAFLDVSDLPAPEPLEKILEALKGDLPPVLLVIRHRKKPLHLPGFLMQKGYLVSVFEKKDHVQVYVFQKTVFQKYAT